MKHAFIVKLIMLFTLLHHLKRFLVSILSDHPLFEQNSPTPGVWARWLIWGRRATKHLKTKNGGWGRANSLNVRVNI